MTCDGRWSLRLGRCAGYAADGAVACGQWATRLGLVLGGTWIRWWLLGFRVWGIALAMADAELVGGYHQWARDRAQGKRNVLPVFSQRGSVFL